jgi:hypothetical protein
MLSGAYLAGRDSRGETFRVVVRTAHGYDFVIVADQLTASGWEADRPSARHCPPTSATPSPDVGPTTSSYHLCPQALCTSEGVTRRP